MDAAHRDFLHLRLPCALRAELEDRANASGLSISVLTRNILAVGLRSISSPDRPDRDPPPAGPAAAMPAQQAAA